ncbi:hypothetical protein [Tardiphaga robiniae]|uniref:Glycosyltransferase RgtA/B/C/D-like domain-containing protein n=1 Tax=Tardiphaga robiniae TaxID=943830 RepID=A0A163ZNN4_9BRAD|nr:hypothetical protein [Tardiphaga robiniae]KZD23683.1 hypothetical protein A4A58_26580 [Tardiphaga robiniae]
MTMSPTHPAERVFPLAQLLPALVGIGVSALLVFAGDQMLNDPDTYIHLAIGQWMLDHGAVPHTDVYSFTKLGEPWISTQWLAQVLYARCYAIAGWAGPVLLAAASIGLTFALLMRFLLQRLALTHAIIFATVGLALMASHLLVRPHVLAMPVMMAWVGTLVAAMDRRVGPSFYALPLITLWANMHGGYVLGVLLVVPMGLDAVLNVARPQRAALALRWAAFFVAALAASCVTPYGWDSLLAARRILGLGEALGVIGEWRPANFGNVGPLELTVLGAVALVLWRGFTLPPMRVVLVLGFVFMALSHIRNAEVMALLAPLVLAKPLGQQIGRSHGTGFTDVPQQRSVVFAGIAVSMIAATLAFAPIRHYAPSAYAAPAAAVTELKKLNLSRVFNDYDFGGYLISRGVPTFIDGRVELYGEKFMVDHNNASGLMEPDNLFRLLKDYDIEATLLRTQSAATKLLDRVDGWEKVYSDDIATIHLRKPGAVHSIAPAVKAN